MSDRNVALNYKKICLAAGLDENKYSGHSLRSGFATSTAELGAEERSIMAMTGHKTTQMVRRYIKEANLFKNNALNKIKNFRIVQIIHYKAVQLLGQKSLLFKLKFLKLLSKGLNINPFFYHLTKHPTNYMKKV